MAEKATNIKIPKYHSTRAFHNYYAKIEVTEGRSAYTLSEVSVQSTFGSEYVICFSISIVLLLDKSVIAFFLINKASAARLR